MYKRVYLIAALILFHCAESECGGRRDYYDEDPYKRHEDGDHESDKQHEDYDHDKHHDSGHDEHHYHDGHGGHH